MGTNNLSIQGIPLIVGYKMAIALLDNQIAAKIAAGEVIDRPSSVVKELVENSIDAGSSQIIIETIKGGLEVIRISDNGCGIPAAEIELAFQRYATSKLSSVADLNSIATLGFRGEALPSITAVADITISTRTAESKTGKIVELQNAVVTNKVDCSMACGTSISVTGLFSRIPVRLGFLKSIASEGMQVQRIITRLALANPNIGISWIKDGKHVLNTNGNTELREVIAALYDHKIAENLLVVLPFQDAHCIVEGLTSIPSINWPTRTNFILFINKRWVQNQRLNYAIEEAYKGFLLQKRYPLTVVNLEIPLNEVDPNIHPRKSEVRFIFEDKVFSAVYGAIRQSLGSNLVIPSMSSVGEIESYDKTRPPVSFWEQQSTVQVQGQLEARELDPMTSLVSYRVLGQIEQTYIVAQSADGLILVDQHAAHERVLYEELMAQISKKVTTIQYLLAPHVLDLPENLLNIVKNDIQILGSYGYDLDIFGEESVILRGVPSISGKVDYTSVFRELLGELALTSDRANLNHRAVALIACHSSIRAGELLNEDVMRGLMVQLMRVPRFKTCPHGRPTLLNISKHQLDREFHRI